MVSSDFHFLCIYPSNPRIPADYNTLLKLYTSPKQVNETRKKLQYLKPRLEAAQKQETDEMLSKLKGLGNSILGSPS